MVTLFARPELGGSALGGGTYKAGEIVEILAIPAPHHRFVRWEGQVVHSVLARTRTLAKTKGIPITAVFEPQHYRLAVECEPKYTGKIEGDGWFPYGVTAPVRAVPANGYKFSHWEGAVADAAKADTTLANPLIGPVKLTAHFKRDVENLRLTAVAEPALGGEVTGGGSFEPGTVARLTARPARGFVFNGWQGSVNRPGSPETDVRVIQDTHVVALFAPQKALIRAKVVPLGAGKVSGDLGVRPCLVPAVLQAEAMPGYVFDGWEGAAPTHADGRITVTPSEAGKIVDLTARFRPAS
ncbi:MAG: hypothetical protein LBC18_02925 [Opitutaceae bacterium]|nr:hypothetical protein [Opitutaceae bacterium]